MTAEAFELPATAHRVIHDVCAYWHSLRPAAELLPARRHVDPLAIPHLLPHLWLLDVHHDPGAGNRPRFRYRLTGTHLDFGLGHTKTGHWVHELTPDFEALPEKHRHFYAAALKARPHYRRGPPNFRHNENVHMVERVLLPLAADARHVDMLLCATVFYGHSGAVLQARI